MPRTSLTHGPTGRTSAPPPSLRHPRPRAHPQLEALEADHRNFQRLLRVFESELAQFHDAGQPDYGVMCDIMHYVTNFPDRTHHPTEEIIFERLLRLDPAARGPIEEIRQEHERLAGAGAELLRLLDEILSDAFIARDSVESPARAYVKMLREHMTKEESELFPRAAARLSPADWEAIAAVTRRLPDPLFSNAPADQEYRAIRERLACA